MVLTDSDYREAFLSTHTLNVHGTQIIGLTATLPPQLVEAFSHVTQNVWNVIRMPSNRREIALHIKVFDSEQDLLDDFIRTCKSCLASYGSKDRALVYCRSRADADMVAHMLGVLPFHAQTDDAGIVALRNGEQRILPATTALGVGFDYAHIRHVIHLNLPYNIFSYLQEIGRIARDGLPGHAIIFCTKLLPKLHSDRTYDLGEQAMQDLVARRNQQCLRIIPSRFMDGVPVTCTLLEGAQLCDYCEDQYTRPAPSQPVALHLVPSAKSPVLPPSSRPAVPANTQIPRPLPIAPVSSSPQIPRPLLLPPQIPIPRLPSEIRRSSSGSLPASSPSPDLPSSSSQQLSTTSTRHATPSTQPTASPPSLGPNTPCATPEPSTSSVPSKRAHSPASSAKNSRARTEKAAEVSSRSQRGSSATAEPQQPARYASLPSLLSFVTYSLVLFPFFFVFADLNPLLRHTINLPLPSLPLSYSNHALPSRRKRRLVKWRHFRLRWWPVRLLLVRLNRRPGGTVRSTCHSRQSSMALQRPASPANWHNARRFNTTSAIVLMTLASAATTRSSRNSRGRSSYLRGVIVSTALVVER